MTNIFQEDKGLIKIHSTCIGMDAIWRPTPNHDIGIDGQIEFLELGSSISTGNIVAVQCKSGPSYFVNQNKYFVKYYPKVKHIRYWSKLNLPVILILHNPDNDFTLYTRVKPQLDKKINPILLKKTDIFLPSVRNTLMLKIKQDYENFIKKNPFDIIEGFRRIKHIRENDKEITGIDFLLAFTNRYQLFFELRMCRINSLFHHLSESSSISLFSEDYDFILRNILQLHAQRMVPDFLEEFDEMWYELHMVPDILTHMTETGKNALQYLWENIGSYLNSANYMHLKIKKIEDLAKCISNNAQLSSDRIDEADRLAESPI